MPKATQEVSVQINQSPDSVRKRMLAAKSQFKEIWYDGLVLTWGKLHDDSSQVRMQDFYHRDSQAAVLRSLAVCEAETIRKMGGPELDMLERNEYLQIRMRVSTAGMYPVGRLFKRFQR